jgi:hypothetical protein
MKISLLSRALVIGGDEGRARSPRARRMSAVAVAGLGEAGAEVNDPGYN